MRVSVTGNDWFFILLTAVCSDSQWLKQGIIAEMETGFFEFNPNLEDQFDVLGYLVKKTDAQR